MFKSVYRLELMSFTSMQSKPTSWLNTNFFGIAVFAVCGVRLWFSQASHLRLLAASMYTGSILDNLIS